MLRDVELRAPIVAAAVARTAADVFEVDAPVKVAEGLLTPTGGGGFIFRHFVNDGIESALHQAQEAAATERSASRAAAQRSCST